MSPKTTMHDYSAYIPAVGHNSVPKEINEIITLAREQYAAERNVEKLTLELGTAEEELRKISEQLLPDKMEELGLPKFTTPDGIEVVVKEEINAHVAKERKNAANDWLEKNNYGNIIKSQVVVPYSKNELSLAHQLIEQLQQQGRLAELDRSVHHQTMLAFVREQLALGKEIPIDIFGIRRNNKSKVKITKVGRTAT